MGWGAECQQPLRCRTGGPPQGARGRGGARTQACSPSRASLTPVACGRSVAGWARELVASRGSGTDPFLSLCLWSTVPQFPHHKTGRTACLGPVRSVQRDGLCGAPRTRQPSAPLLPFLTIRPTEGQREEVSPRLAAKQGYGEAPLPPTLLGPRFAGQPHGQWGGCRSGQPVPARPPTPRESRTVPLGNSPCGQTPGSPGQPGPEWAQHFTVCMERPQEPRPGVPTTLYSLKLSLMTTVWLSPRAREPQVPTSPSPSGPPASALAPLWFLLGGVSSPIAGPCVERGLRDPGVPPHPSPTGVLAAQGCPWF